MSYLFALSLVAVGVLLSEQRAASARAHDEHARAERLSAQLRQERAERRRRIATQAPLGRPAVAPAAPVPALPAGDPLQLDRTTMTWPSPPAERIASPHLPATAGTAVVLDLDEGDIHTQVMPLPDLTHVNGGGAR